MNEKIKQKISTTKRAKTDKIFFQKLNDKNIIIKVIGVFNGVKKESKWECMCGEQFIAKGRRIKGKSFGKCNKCVRLEVVKQQELNYRIDILETDTKLIGKFTGLLEKTLFECKCGNEYINRPDIVLRGTRCKECFINWSVNEGWNSEASKIKRKITQKRIGKTEKTKEKTKKTNLERYGVENVFQSKIIKQKITETNQERYGVNNCMQDSNIHSKNMRAQYKTKWYITPKHNIWYCQGYEPQLFDELLKEYKEEDIITDYKNMPHFWYIDIFGIRRRYFPDCYIKSTNTIYEVKSEYTYNQGLKNNVFQLKEKSVTDEGFNFILKIY